MVLSAGKSTVPKDVSPLNTLPPKTFTNGRYTDTNFEHPSKALFLMYVASGKFADTNPEQPLKAELPMVVVYGNFTAVTFVS